jgi:hypothetical protein
MAVQLDLITHKKLILIKQIYQRAEVQSASQHSDVDRILSLIGFDLANETLLKNAITAVDSTAEIISNIKSLIKTANSVFAIASPQIPPVPDAQKIRRVRDIRNGAMHEAKYPTATDISDCRTYTRDFLQQLVSNVWGLDFNSIRLTDLVRGSEVKSHLIQAEAELEAGNYTSAAAKAVAGFNLAFGVIQSSIVGQMPQYVDAIMISGGNETKKSRDVYEALKKTRRVLAVSVIGLNYQNYIYYRRLTQYIHVAHFGGGHIEAAISGPKPTEDEAAYIVNYAITAVLQIEALVGDISKPFGGDIGRFL